MVDGNFDRDGKYLTHILVLGFKGCMHTCGRPDDQMWWVLGTTALLVVVQDVCAEWMKVPSIPSVAKLKMKALLEAWGMTKDFILDPKDGAKGVLLVKLQLKEVLQDPRISVWTVDCIYDGADEAWKDAVWKVFGKCKCDGDDGVGSTKRIALAIGAVVRASEIVNHALPLLPRGP
jgi:hypothetical protein